MKVDLKRLLATTLITTSVFVGAAMPAFAENGTNSVKNMKQQVQADRQTLRKDIAQRKSEKLDKYCQNLTRVLNSQITRIHSRITKQNANGWDTSAATQDVTNAQTSLNSASSLCQQAVAKFDSVPADKWSTQQPVIAEAKSLAKQAHDAFTAAHKSLVAATKALVANLRTHKGQSSAVPNNGEKPSPSPITTQQ